MKVLISLDLLLEGSPLGPINITTQARYRPKFLVIELNNIDQFFFQRRTKCGALEI